MKTTAALLAFAASASAFAPLQSTKSSSALSEFAGGYVGAEGPEPIPFSPKGTSIEFDPCGFAEVGSLDSSSRAYFLFEWVLDCHLSTCHSNSHFFVFYQQRAPEWLPWFREAELKHGRAAMLATLGFVVPEFIRVPGEAYSFEAIPKVIDAHDALPQSMIQIFGWISFLEACSFPALANMNEYDRAPGDFGFDPVGLYPTDPSKQKKYQLAELKNGRLAMIAIGGMVAGASITGHGFPYLP